MTGQGPPSIEKFVNPLGTVTTITVGMTAELQTDILDEVVSQLAAEDTIIHENCDESLFRPVVAIFCDEETRKRNTEEEEIRSKSELCKPPEHIPNKLIVPVIAKEVDDEMCKRVRAQQNETVRYKSLAHGKTEQTKFIEFSSLNNKTKSEETKTIKTNIKTFIDTRKKIEAKSCSKDKATEFMRMTSCDKTNTFDKKFHTNNTNEILMNTIKEKDIDKETVKKARKLEPSQTVSVAQIKTENLNMSDLADSLMELQTNKEEHESALKAEDTKKNEEKKTMLIKSMEMVEKYDKGANTKTKNKNLLLTFLKKDDTKENKIDTNDSMGPAQEIKEKFREKTNTEDVKKRSINDNSEINDDIKIEIETKNYKKKDFKKEAVQQEEHEMKLNESEKNKDTKQKIKNTEEEGAGVTTREIEIKDEYKTKTTGPLKNTKETKTNISLTKVQILQKHNCKDSTESTVITQQPLKNKKPLPSTDLFDNNIINESNTKICSSKNLSCTEIMKSEKVPHDKIIIDIPTPMKLNKKTKKAILSGLEDFPKLNPLESLPPLPALKPLELYSNISESYHVDNAIANALPNLSLINFESPSQENISMLRKVTSNEYTEDNLIYALCGSLHYENKNGNKSELYSPTLSLTRSSSVVGEHSLADYKSLTENDEQYISLEFNSHDTNTTNTNTTTNDKLTSSSNGSSASEEVVSLEGNKMSKRQKRKLLKSKKEANAVTPVKPSLQPVEMDEELRPLIDNMGSGLSESHVDSSGLQYLATRHTPLNGPIQTATHIKTDSEGPITCATSDDNFALTLPSGVVPHVCSTLHKIKTKKLEHKINLIAAIEAATSSSTSSAEESGIDAIEGRQSYELESTALVSLDTTIGVIPLLNTPTVSLATTTINSVSASSIASSGTNGAAKKKTKRRKR